MAAKNVQPLDKYLKAKETKVLVQSKISTSLHGDVMALLLEKDQTLQEVIEASLKRYVDESKK